MRRMLSTALVLTSLVFFSSDLRADYALWIVTPENVGEVGNLKVEAKTDSFGVIRFVVRRDDEPSEQGQPTSKDEGWRRYLKGMLRLEVSPNVWTEAPVVADAREGATEYHFAVAPAHLDIASFHVIQTEGLGGEWYEIPLKAFAPKEAGESIEATKKETTETTKREANEPTKKEPPAAPATEKEGK